MRYTIDTDRLILRGFVEADSEVLKNNWKYYISINSNKSNQEIMDATNKWIEDYRTNSLTWVAENKLTHSTVGNIGVIKRNYKHNYCELGYSVCEQYWGQGYATEMLKAIIQHLFVEEDIHVIEAKHYENNIASGRVMVKAGMIKEATLKERRYNGYLGKYMDLVCYCIINPSH